MATPPDDPGIVAAALEQLEAEARRREDEAIDAGRAIRVSFDPIVACAGEDADELVERAKAHEIERLRANGETRAIYFDEALVIETGVPRTGRTPPDWRPVLNESDCSFRPTTAAPVAVSPTTSAPPVAAPKAVEWTRITVQIAPPDERSTGIISEGKFAVFDGEIHVRDLWDKPLGSTALGPNDDPKVVARRLLREKTAKKWSAFYNPIQYPPRVH